MGKPKPEILDDKTTDKFYLIDGREKADLLITKELLKLWVELGDVIKISACKEWGENTTVEFDSVLKCATFKNPNRQSITIIPTPGA